MRADTARVSVWPKFYKAKQSFFIESEMAAAEAANAMEAAEAENAMEAAEVENAMAAAEAENTMEDSEAENAIEAAESEEGKAPATEIEEEKVEVEEEVLPKAAAAGSTSDITILVRVPALR